MKIKELMKYNPETEIILSIIDNIEQDNGKMPSVLYNTEYATKIDSGVVVINAGTRF